MKTTKILFTLLFALNLVGCAADQTKEAEFTDITLTAPDELSSRFRVRLKDAPPNDESITEVNVDIKDVQICSGEGCVSIGGAQTLNLLDLTGGNTAVLSDVFLTGESVQELRFVLGPDNSLVTNGEPVPLKVPSGHTSGLKLKGEWPLEPGMLTELLIDFDPSKSLVRTKGSGYILKPVLRVEAVVIAPQSAVTGVALPDVETTISAGEGGAYVTVPPGAVDQPTLIWVSEQKVEDLTSYWEIGPEEFEFNIPVLVAIPYDRTRLPEGYQDVPIGLWQNGEPVETEEDAVEKTLKAETLHFSFWNGKAKAPVLNTIAPGVVHHNCTMLSPPVHVVVIDRSVTEYNLKLIMDAGEGDTVTLQRAKTLAVGNDPPAIVAINGAPWGPVEIDGKQGDPQYGAWPATTTIVGHQPKKLYSLAEVLIGVGEQVGEGIPIQRITKNADLALKAPAVPGSEFYSEVCDPFVPGCYGNLTYQMFGSTTTILANGECKGAGEKSQWSAIGYSDQKIVMVSSSNVRWSAISDKELCEVFAAFQVDQAVRLDGATAAQLVVNGKLVNTHYHQPVNSGVRHIASVIGLVPVAAPPPPPVQVSGIVLEENSPAVQCEGPENYWHTSNIGSGGSMRWTYNNDVNHGAENACTYRFANVPAGKYAVQAHIPHNYATTRKACYQIKVGQQTYKASVDQSKYFDSYVTLAIVDVVDKVDVRLEDLTGEAWANYWVGFDAIRLLPAAEDAPVGLIAPSCN